MAYEKTVADVQTTLQAILDGERGMAQLVQAARDKIIADAVASLQSGSSGGVTLGVISPSLPHWRQSTGAVGSAEASGPSTGKLVVVSGDSTSTEANDPGLYTGLRLFNYPGGELEGVTVMDGGSNGASLAAFLSTAGGHITDNISWVISQNPQLVILSWGINDIRTNGVTQAQLVTMLTTAVNTLRNALPSCDFVLRTPNTFLTTDPGATGKIVPSTVNVTGAANNGSGLIRLTLASLAGSQGVVGATNSMKTGDSITVASVGGTTEANGTWVVTVIDANTIDLQTSTFTNAYTSGGTAVGTLAQTAQNYSTILKNAYAQLATTWPNVVLVDMQERVFGTICQSTSDYMTDILHPNSQGYDQIARELAAVISLKPAFSARQAEYARRQNTSNPWAVYPREVEDPNFYDLVFSGWVSTVTANAGNISIHTQTGSLVNDYALGDYYSRDFKAVWPGDLVQMGTLAPWTIPPGVNGAYQANDVLQLTSLGGSLPPVANTTYQPLKIWRPKFYHYLDISGTSITGQSQRNLQTLVQQKRTYPYRAAFLVTASGTTAQSIAQLNGEPSVYQRMPRPGDLFVVPGFAPITLTTGMAVAWNNGSIQITTSVDMSAMTVGRVGYIFSTTPDRDAAERASAPVIFPPLNGTLSASQVVYIGVARAGELKRIDGFLITAGNPGSTVITLKDERSGATIGTATFVAGTTGTPTIAWNSGSSYRMKGPTILSATVTGTPGTNAATAVIIADVFA